MNISFTLNQLELFARSEVRYWNACDLVRSYKAVPVGEPFLADQLHYSIFVTDDFAVYNNETGDRCISIRGQELSLRETESAILVHQAMGRLHLAMQGFKKKQGDLYKATDDFQSLCSPSYEDLCAVTDAITSFSHDTKKSPFSDVMSAKRHLCNLLSGTNW